MIISTEHEFIFAAVPKTGTHSVRRALREQMGPGDLEQVGLFVQKKLPIPELARIGHGHISLAQVQPFLKPDDFRRYFKFGFVRNPFDRFISYCAFMTRNRNVFSEDPQKVMREILAAPPTNHILFKPQHLFFAGADGELMTDYVGRVETMQQSYDEVCERIGIATAPLDTVNSSSRGNYRDYYDAPLIDAVSTLYARDLELFGYEY